jgi:nitroreductase
MKEDLIKTILSRRSIRKYKSDPVKPEDIKTLLEAAMAAPSASNRKPWHFIVLTDREKIDKLADAHPYAKMLYQAPLCIAVLGDKNITKRFWVQDCSAATENLLLAATALGLGTVWLGVYPREERVQSVREVLKLPEHIIPLNLISIGYPAEMKEPRTQYDDEKIHREEW